MKALKILSRHLTAKSKLLLVVFALMTLSFLTFLASPFLLIWTSWSLAWRVGTTGFIATFVLFIAWWFLYNSFYTTIDSIRNEKKENQGTNHFRGQLQ